MWTTDFKEQDIELDPEVHDYIVALQAEIARLKEANHVLAKEIFATLPEKLATVKTDAIREMLFGMGYDGKFIGRESTVTIGRIWDWIENLEKKPVHKSDTKYGAG